MKENKDYIENILFNMFYECVMYRNMKHAEIILMIREFIANKGWNGD